MLIPAPLTPALPPFAIPDKRCGLAVPGLGRLLEPGADLRGSAWVLSIERAPFEDTLDGLGHVQPAATGRRVEWHDPMLAQPDYHLGLLQERHCIGDGPHHHGATIPGDNDTPCREGVFSRRDDNHGSPALKKNYLNQTAVDIERVFFHTEYATH